MVIQWGCLAKCQGTRKEGWPEFHGAPLPLHDAPGYSNEHFTNAFRALSQISETTFFFSTVCPEYKYFFNKIASAHRWAL